MIQLQESKYDGSDDDESFYSAEEPRRDLDDIEDSDSFYSANGIGSNEDIVSVGGLSLGPGMEQDGNDTYMSFEDSHEEKEYTMHGDDDVGSETIRFVTDDIDIRASSLLGIGDGENYLSLTTQSPPEAENSPLESRGSNVLTLDIQSDSDLEMYYEKRRDRQNRSPSVRILSWEDANRAKEFNGSSKIEDITVPDVISLAVDPIVEFDGTKQVIVIQSDDEENLERPFSRKREKTPETITLHDLQQSPYQRKMRKLKQIADRANGFSNKTEGASSRVMEP